jgi:hypothetical protein
MNIQLNLPAEYEQALQQQAAAHGRDVNTYIQEIVTESLADEVESQRKRSSKRDPKRRPFAEWLDSWIARHPVLDHPVDDSRESIYEGRGE